MSLVIFDLDDTLLAGDSEGAWADFMLKQGIVKDKNFIINVKKFESDYRNGNLDIDDYVKFLLEPLVGYSESEVERLALIFSEEVVKKYSDGLTHRLLRKHLEDNCLIVSGTLDFSVREIASILGVDTSISTLAEIKGGVFSGKVEGKANFGIEKVKRVKEWLVSNPIINLNEIFVYSDSIYDLPLLEYGNRPFAVNPDKKLRVIAEERAWQIIER